MALVLSLQGCMAVGKTTALRYLQQRASHIYVSLEDTAEVVSEVRRRGLHKNVYPEYLEIQKLWLAAEVRRWERAQAHPCTVMDFGAEEIEFYTLHYPASIGADWDVAGPLCAELEAVRRCLPRRILFLDASDEELRRRKEHDATRSREFFEQYFTTLLPLKRQWFAGRPDVDILDTTALTPEALGSAVLAWVEACRARQSG